MWTPPPFVGVAVGVGGRYERTPDRRRHSVEATSGAHERAAASVNQVATERFTVHIHGIDTPLGRCPREAKGLRCTKRGETLLLSVESFGLATPVLFSGGRHGCVVY